MIDKGHQTIQIKGYEVSIFLQLDSNNPNIPFPRNTIVTTVKNYVIAAAKDDIRITSIIATQIAEPIQYTNAYTFRK